MLISPRVRMRAARFQSRHSSDSDEAPVGGKLNVNHAMGGAVHCVRRW